MQALKMIDNFKFSEDERKIKESFRNQLEHELWYSHREFAENPLLLTIMLMSFEEYSIVPLKMYKFYEMAFETLPESTMTLNYLSASSSPGCQRM